MVSVVLEGLRMLVLQVELVVSVVLVVLGVALPPRGLRQMSELSLR